LFVNSGLFAIIVLTLASTPALPGGVRERKPTAGRLRAALAHARQQPSIRLLLTLQTIAMVFFTASIPVEVVFVQHTLHAGAGGYGALVSAWGAGAVVGSAVYARWNGLRSRTLIGIGAAALGAGFLGMAAAPSIGVAMAAAAVAGLGNGIENVAARTALQEQVDPRWMTMMMSFAESVAEAAPGAGIVLGGTLAALVSPRAALAVAGVGSLAVAVVVLVVLRAGRIVDAGRPRTELAVDAPTASAPGVRETPPPARAPAALSEIDGHFDAKLLWGAALALVAAISTALRHRSARR
jgi:MFS family permease